MEKIDIIIPTKGHVSDLFSCLKHLNELNDAKSFDIEAVIVDDRSSKGDREDIITRVVKYDSYKNIKVKTVFLSKQLGFCKAVNVGLDYSLSKKKQPSYIGVMHDDVTVFDNWLSALVTELETSPAVYGASSLSTSKYDLHNVQSLKIPELAGSEFKDEEMNDLIRTFLADKNPIYVDQLQFNAVIFRKEAFLKFGKLDEANFSSINEEYKLCQRLIEAEKKLAVVPASCIKHKSRMTNPDENPNQLTYDTQRKATEFVDMVQRSISDKKRYVIYTFAQRKEDFPRFEEYSELDEYVCFTSVPTSVIDGRSTAPWKFFNVSDLATALGFPQNGSKMIEYLKLNPHIFFGKINVSVWVEPGSARLLHTEDLVRLMKPSTFLLAPDSASYSCAYRYLISLKNGSYIAPQEFNNVIEILKWCKYPEDNGLLDSRILIRKHNDIRCISAMEKIWHFVSTVFTNDMLFINFVLWRMKEDYSFIPLNLMKKAFFSKEA